MVRSGWPLRSQPGKSQPACRRPCGPRRVLAPCPGRVATGDWSSGRVPAGCGTAVELTGLGFRRMAVMFASNRSSSKPGWWPRSRSATLTPHAPVAQHGESATLRTWRSQVRVLSGAPGPSAWPPRRWPIADAQERHGHGFPRCLGQTPAVDVVDDQVLGGSGAAGAAWGQRLAPGGQRMAPTVPRVPCR